ncbi:hypothetical protein U5922_007895 [Aquicoccus sp. G2-2]|uniref:hypothetical protein n=1 Tax=Aquicoccus sp. G2-2 TaxID=3092120 RepID=UPI002ADF7FDA|nr:hypothetical protein [Aquicoccus sp. G2-2]MEA1113399.1 hypothetical protein [Aquicoccus sp. G2-2]
MPKLKTIVESVVREHVESAAFQWAQRDTLAAEDPPDLPAIAHVDARLEANLDGIRIAGAAAWPFLINAFESFPEKGELFAVAFHALDTADARRIEQALAFARFCESGPRGLFGAFEWLAPKITAPVVRVWIDAGDPIKIEAALTALIAHGGNPGTRLERFLRHDAPGVRAAAERLQAAITAHEDALPAP